MRARIAGIWRARGWVIGALVGAVLVAAPVAAQSRAATGVEERGAALRVYLLTMEPGDAVWERFGHNAIWIHDPMAGTDFAYNYGVFDFASEDFVPNFIRGRLLYWLDRWDAGRMVQAYAGAGRTVWAQELNLTPSQRLELMGFLEWNARPENRVYRYDYYRDNCSTRVRDAIDRVLGGRIREATEGVASGTTFRWHTRRAVAADVPVYTGLELAMGQPIDRPISRWEEMFLPMKLRENLAAVQVPDGNGGEAPLVAREVLLHEATGRAALPALPPSRVVAYLLAGLVLGGGLALLGWRAKGSPVARGAFATSASLWLLASGLLGALLAFLWGFTDHWVTYRNENVLQIGPLALVVAGLLPGAVLGRPGALRAARAFAMIIAALSVVGLLLQAIPGLDQANGEIIALALPVNAGLALALWLLPPGRAPRRAAMPAAPRGQRERAAPAT